MKPLDCLNNSDVAARRGKCTQSTALWEVVSPGYARWDRMHSNQRYYLHADCVDLNSALRVVKRVSTCQFKL